MDETSVGSKPRKQNNGRGAPYAGGGGTDRIPVVGIVDRSTTQIHAKFAVRNGAGLRLTGGQMPNILEQVAQKNDRNVIITDELSSYEAVSRKGPKHISVDHSMMFSDGDPNANRIESFWAIVKRGVYGVYHSVSGKHLQKHIDGFTIKPGTIDLRGCCGKCNLAQDWTILPEAA